MKKTRVFAVLTVLFYASQANAFKFDVWESGMDKKTILKIARKNDMKLTGGERRYSYSEEILGERASVQLHLTRGDYKLMELSISWVPVKTRGLKARELFSLVKGIIEDKHPISKKYHPEYGLVGSKKYSYMLDRNSSVDLELRLISLVLLTYRDLRLKKIDAKRAEWDKQEAKRKAVLKDFGKFNPEASSKKPDSKKGSKIYSWTDENGVVHFSNMEKGNNSAVVKVKPFEKVHLKKVLWYHVRLKNGKSIYKARKIKRMPGNKLAIMEQSITTQLPVNEISQIAEVGKINGKIVTEMRSPSSF